MTSMRRSAPVTSVSGALSRVTQGSEQLAVFIRGGGFALLQDPGPDPVVLFLQEIFQLRPGAREQRGVLTGEECLQQDVEFLPNLQESDDWRVNTESSLVAPISSRIGVKLSYVVRFDKVPEPTFKNTDRLFTTGIQLTF